MPNVKVAQTNTTSISLPSKRAGESDHVHVVVTIDGMTRSSVATIKKDMSEAVKRDLKVLKKFGLVTY